jgi:hypothetical protein
MNTVDKHDRTDEDRLEKDLDSKDPYSVGAEEVVEDDSSYTELRGWRKVSCPFPPSAPELASVDADFLSLSVL